ncbi:MAG TPA: twitching motility protein PilT [Clostridia bacterium]|nr:twitching motility protein PilT [Clostridia bacterium]
MVRLIYGDKGSGKTKMIIDDANRAAENPYSNIAYLYVNKKYIYELKHNIRFIDTSDYDIKGSDLFLGFINGLIASNFDLNIIYIDGFLKHMDKSLDQLGDLFKKLDEISIKHSVDFVLSVSANENEMPDFMKKFIA